jgi:hypothetical protein
VEIAMNVCQQITNVVVVVIAATAIFTMGGTGHLPAIQKSQTLAQFVDNFNTILSMKAVETTSATNVKTWQLKATVEVNEDAWEAEFVALYGGPTAVPSEASFHKMCLATDLELMTALPVVDYNCDNECCKNVRGASIEQVPHFATLTIGEDGGSGSGSDSEISSADPIHMCFHLTDLEYHLYLDLRDDPRARPPGYTLGTRENGNQPPVTLKIRHSSSPSWPTLYTVCSQIAEDFMKERALDQVLPKEATPTTFTTAQSNAVCKAGLVNNMMSQMYKEFNANPESFLNAFADGVGGAFESLEENTKARSDIVVAYAHSILAGDYFIWNGTTYTIQSIIDVIVETKAAQELGIAPPFQTTMPKNTKIILHRPQSTTVTTTTIATPAPTPAPTTTTAAAPTTTTAAAPTTTAAAPTTTTAAPTPTPAPTAAPTTTTAAAPTTTAAAPTTTTVATTLDDTTSLADTTTPDEATTTAAPPTTAAPTTAAPATDAATTSEAPTTSTDEAIGFCASIGDAIACANEVGCKVDPFGTCVPDDGRRRRQDDGDTTDANTTDPSQTTTTATKTVLEFVVPAILPVIEENCTLTENVQCINGGMTEPEFRHRMGALLSAQPKLNSAISNIVMAQLFERLGVEQPKYDYNTKETIDTTINTCATSLTSANLDAVFVNHIIKWYKEAKDTIDLPLATPDGLTNDIAIAQYMVGAVIYDPTDLTDGVTDENQTWIGAAAASAYLFDTIIDANGVVHPQVHTVGGGPLLVHLMNQHPESNSDTGRRKRDGRIAQQQYQKMLENALQPALNALSPATEVGGGCERLPSAGFTSEMASFFNAGKRIGGFSQTFGSAADLILEDPTWKDEPSIMSLSGEEDMDGHVMPSLMHTGIEASTLMPFGRASTASDSCNTLCKTTTRLWFPTQVLTAGIAVWLLINTYYAQARKPSDTPFRGYLWFLFCVVLMITCAFMFTLCWSLYTMTLPIHSCGFNGAGNMAGANFRFLFHDSTNLLQVDEVDHNDQGVEYGPLPGFWWLVGATAGQFFILVWAIIFSIISVWGTDQGFGMYNPMTGVQMSNGFSRMLF